MDVPSHVALIMDGNGRWAKEKGLPRLKGHSAGVRSLKEIIRCSSHMGIKYLTVYAFSTENWKRPETEVFGIFRLMVLYLAKETEELHGENVKINFLGDLTPLPADARKAAVKAAERTAGNSGLIFNIALNYGGRAEILRAVRAIAAKAAEGKLDPASVGEEEFSRELYTANIPDPQLIIRTGGEYRLSNFMTWQSAYSEIYVTDVYWPDFTPEEYVKALAAYNSRDRRFGGIK